MSFFSRLFQKKPFAGPNANEVFEQTMKDARAFMTGEGLLEIGILYDIEQLGGGFYGRRAYQVLFANLDPQQLKGCFIWDGDALGISGEIYCICLQTTKEAQIDYVKGTMSNVSAPGLLSVGRRFVTGRVAAPNYLVHSGLIDSAGNFCVQTTGMIGEEWADGTSWTIYRKI